jgi:hypothetical protein
MTALEIEAIALSCPSTAADANDPSDRCPTPATAGSELTRSLVDVVQRAGAAGIPLFPTFIVILIARLTICRV